MFYFDPIYFLFILPGLLLSIVASILLNYWNQKYKKIQNLNQITGAELVAKVCERNNITVNISVSDSDLSDSYDSRSQTLNLSRDVIYGSSISSVAIAAHELGHVLQHQSKSPLVLLRNFIVPAVNLGTNLGYILLIAGFVIGILEVSEFGLILFSFSTIFTLLTLPIEIDASFRALSLLKTEQILFPDEIPGAQKVLAAAALTYVAALIQSFGQILYFFFRIRSRD